jgi:hypothetical protein
MSLASILPESCIQINRNIMKNRILYILCFMASFFAGNKVLAQSGTLYTIPDNYRFDYEVDQQITGRKNQPDTIRFYYTKSGDYAAASFSQKARMKGNLFIILTRQGNVVVMNEHRKNIKIVSIPKMISDMTQLVKYIKIDSLMANMRRNTNGREFSSVKTGNTKIIGSYTAEEYNISRKKGEKASIWYAKVDFNTQGDYLKGIIGGNFLNMMNAGRQSEHPVLQALLQPKVLVTSIETTDSSGTKRNNLQTISIKPTDLTVSTMGYAVDDYSNKSLPEIFESEMQKGSDL